MNRKACVGVALFAAIAVTTTAAAQTAARTAAPAAAPAAGRSVTPGGVDQPDVYGATRLHKAADAGDIAAAERLIAAGANVNAVTRYGVTPLSIATMRGNAAMASMLLKAGADVNALTGEGEPVLLTAARAGNLDVLRALLGAGADPNVRERFYGQTALMWAAIENHADVIEVLAAKAADVNARANLLEGDPTWRYGKDSRNGINGEALQNLNTNFSKGGLTALMYAAREGSIAALRMLIDKGAAINATDPEGFSSLHLAIMNARYDAAAALIDKGADVNQGDRGGQTALYAIADMRSLLWTYNRPTPRAQNTIDTLQLAERLIAKGAKVDAALKGRASRPLGGGGAQVAGAGSTPFLRATVVSDLPMMRLLLKHGADPKWTNDNGDTALHAAAGLRWDDNTMRPATTLGFGTEDDSLEAVKMLLDLGLDVNAIDKQGFTPVHGAAERGANQIVQLLFDHGAKLDVMSKPSVRGTNVDNEPPVNVPGQTPIDAALAADPPRLETVALLRKLMGQDPNAPLPKPVRKR